MTSNEIVNFLRSDHFTASGGNSKKTILEMAITSALNDPTVAGAGGYWLVYDHTTGTIQKSTASASSWKDKGFQLDHVFERQFISALFMIEKGDHDPGLSILNDLLSLANISENLVWIHKDLHTAKSNFFGPAKAVLTEHVGHYLDQCQKHFKGALDVFDSQQGVGIVKNLVQAIKYTPWYLGGWDDFAGQPWFH